MNECNGLSSSSSRNIIHRSSSVPIKFVMEHTICTLCGVRLDKAAHDEPLCTTSACNSNIYHLDCVKKFEDRLHKCEVCRRQFRIYQVRMEGPPEGKKIRQSPSLRADEQKTTKKKRKKKSLWKIFTERKRGKSSGKKKVLQEKIEVESIGNPSDLSSEPSDNEKSYDDVDELQRQLHIVQL